MDAIMRMIKLIRKTPSSNIPQINVLLLLAVLQFTIMIFTFNPCITAQIKLTPISGPNDWTEIIDTLQNAKIEGRSVCISLLPPSKTPPICPTCKYSEPYRLDYHSWAKAIAELSLRYSNLTGYTIGDLQENLNLGYIRQTYIDSMEVESNSINPKLQFIKTRPNIYYVDKYAIGNGNGSSWTNAANSISALNWSSIHGGDTVYVSGGTDSVTYGRTQLSGIVGNTGVIIITKGKEAGHNGKVIFLAQDTLHNYTFQFTNCSNIKTNGLTFKWTGIISGNNEQVISIASSSYICIDNCHIISNGKVEGIIPSASTFISITNNTIESLANNYVQEQDGIEFAGGGGGGHTITGNTIILRGTNATPHKDCIQIGGVEGLTNSYLTTIANNYMTYNAEGVGEANGFYAANIGSNRFLVYNNIITINTYNGAHCFEIDNSPQPTHINSLRLFNNTFITGGTDDRPIVLGTVDTVIAENNIFMNDSLGLNSIFLLGYNTVPHLTFDYNHYFQRGRAVKIDTSANGTNSITWAQWRALGGYDAHSDTGIVNFANIWGTDASDYKLATGSTDIDGGTDLSAYFTIDIVGTTRPLGTKWNRGALETAVTSN